MGVCGFVEVFVWRKGKEVAERRFSFLWVAKSTLRPHSNGIQPQMGAEISGESFQRHPDFNFSRAPFKNHGILSLI